ncbi:MAG: RHS repeat-associated core domain-containing protein [Rhabdochlamydiaceae bacterium]|nr:RHS repeat-associated core domain-containing protein [Candidatus Amphrikana amoebophyrae]
MDPFGSHLIGKRFAIPWVFQAKHFDQETGLVYFGNRYYDPELMRWTSLDPLGPVDGMNPYLFAGGNPVCHIDVDGNAAVALPFLIWGVRGASLAVPGLAPIVWGATAGIAAYHTGKHIKAHMEKKKAGKQRDGTPRTNKPQNKQFGNACKEIERKLGRKLSRKEVEGLHRDISKQNYGYHEIVEEGYYKFGGK